MRVTFIGSGNVATVLGRKVLNAGHSVLQVFSRDHAHAKELADEMQASPVSSVAGLDHSADIYIIAIADDSLNGIHNWLKLDRQLVVHTAGSVSIDVLKKISRNYGVLYPLQSLRKEKRNSPDIPFLVDGNHEETKIAIKQFAETISTVVRFAGDTERVKLHMAAVISNNFSNHLYTLTEDFCNKESVDFRILIPLISETVNGLRDHLPATLQTGPAVRNDQATIDKHLQLLKAYPDLLLLYEMFTRNIRSLN